MFGNLEYTTYEATKNSVEVLNNSIKNLSNLKSIGYRKTETSFVTTLNGEIAKHQNVVHSQGPLRKTNEPFDLALDGPGFFEVELTNGQRAFTRAGRLSLNSDGELVTEEGYRVLPQVEDTSNSVFKISSDKEKNELGLDIKVASPNLIIPPNLTPEVLEDGTVNGISPENGEKVKIGKISIVSFNNPQGLEPIGKSYFIQTKASGQAQEVNASPDSATKIKQGFLEFGNVDMVAELMNLSQLKNVITAQIKALKAIDKIYENVHYTISRNA